MMSINWHPWRLSNHPNNWPVFVDVWSVKLILIIFFRAIFKCAVDFLWAVQTAVVYLRYREKRLAALYSSKKHFVLERLNRSILVLYSPWGGCWSITTRPPGIMGNFVPRVSPGTTLHYGLGATLHIYYNLVMSIYRLVLRETMGVKYLSINARTFCLCTISAPVNCHLHSATQPHCSPEVVYQSAFFLISGGSSSFTRLSLEFNSLSV